MQEKINLNFVSSASCVLNFSLRGSESVVTFGVMNDGPETLSDVS